MCTNHVPWDWWQENGNSAIERGEKFFAELKTHVTRQDYYLVSLTARCCQHFLTLPPGSKQACLSEGGLEKPNATVKVTALFRPSRWPDGSHASSGKPCRIGRTRQRAMALFHWRDTPNTSQYYQRRYGVFKANASQAEIHHTPGTATARPRLFIQWGNDRRV